METAEQNSVDVQGSEQYCNLDGLLPKCMYLSSATIVNEIVHCQHKHCMLVAPGALIKSLHEGLKAATSCSTQGCPNTKPIYTLCIRHI